MADTVEALGRDVDEETADDGPRCKWKCRDAAVIRNPTQKLTWPSRPCELSGRTKEAGRDADRAGAVVRPSRPSTKWQRTHSCE